MKFTNKFKYLGTIRMTGNRVLNTCARIFQNYYTCLYSKTTSERKSIQSLEWFRVWTVCSSENFASRPKMVEAKQFLKSTTIIKLL